MGNKFICAPLRHPREQTCICEFARDQSRHCIESMRRKNRRIGCPPDSVNLAMRFKMKCIQEQSNTTTRIQCYFENLFRDIGFSSSYCFVPVYLSLY